MGGVHARHDTSCLPLYDLLDAGQYIAMQAIIPGGVDVYVQLAILADPAGDNTILSCGKMDVVAFHSR